MLLWYLIVLLIAVVGIRFNKKGFYTDYIGKEQSNSIKGIFVLLVFLGHAIMEVKDCGFVIDRWVDKAAFQFFEGMSQLVVALFFFYSGYGVMISLKTKGEAYLDSFPKKRLLTTLLNFDIAVCFYILLAWALGKKVNLLTVLLSLVGWESVGNSNWYVFVILLCYLSFYFAFKAVRSSRLEALGGSVVILLCGMLILRRFKLPFWYNTMLVFPAGVCFALYSDCIESIVRRRYWLCLMGLVSMFLFLHFFGDTHPVYGMTYNIKSIVFALLIVVLTMKVRIGNSFSNWCGFSLFPIYIYQRMPMSFMRGIMGNSWISAHSHLFIFFSFSVTVIIALLYNRFIRVKL